MVENCFGYLKGRWRFLRGTLPVSPKRSGVSFRNELTGEIADPSEDAQVAHDRFHARVCTAILTGFVMHNFTLAHGDLASRSWKLSNDEVHMGCQDGLPVPPPHDTLAAARRMRQAIRDHINGYHRAQPNN